MRVIRSTTHPGRARRRVAVLGALLVMALYAQFNLAGPAAAAPFTGGFSPTIVGGRADLNGSGTATGRDDANEFYGATHIIDGMLDCDAWGPLANAGFPGDNVITAADDCNLLGYDGTPDGVTIRVRNGLFQVSDGPLPTVFPHPATPNNPDVGDSRFAWSAIDGRVDSNGNEEIDPDGDDCHFGLIGVTPDEGLGDPTDGFDILGNDEAGTNPCGFVAAPNTSDNGLVDRNNDADISAADSCTNGCFFGLDLLEGKVQARQCPGFEGDPRNHVVGTPASETLIGTAGHDIICGRGGNDTLVGRRGRDLLLGGVGADVGLGGPGADKLRGGRGADELRGGTRADILRGGPGPDELRGGFGPDRLFGGRRNDDLFGGPGNDALDGGPGLSDRCFGGLGVDTFVRCEQQQ
jgi:hypothetical protein